MDLKLSTRKMQTVLVVDLAGKITAGDSLAVFRQAIRDEVAKGHNKILLNLKDVTYVDSSGLGEFIMAQGTVNQIVCGVCGSSVFKNDDGDWDPCVQCESKQRKTWGSLKLSNPGTQVTQLLQFTKLYSVFDVHQSEQEALASF